MKIFKILKMLFGVIPMIFKIIKHIPTLWTFAKTYKKLAIFGAGLVALIVGVFFEVDKMGNVLSVLGLLF